MSKCTILSTCESLRTVYKHPKNYEDHSVRLARSIRKNGGTCKDYPIVMWYGDDAVPSQDTCKKLYDMGCRLVPGKCAYKKYPLFNKISACQTRIDSEYVMWMDSDMYVLGDLGPLVDNDKEVLVSPDQKSTHRWSSSDQDLLWEKIYKVLNVERPPKKIPCHIDSSVGNFYFCSGLFKFKTGIGFPQTYLQCSADILGMGGPFTANFTQTGLGMAVHKGGYSYDLIPEKYHYFYTLHDKKLAGDTRVVHYQDNRVTEVSDKEWNVT